MERTDPSPLALKGAGLPTDITDTRTVAGCEQYIFHLGEQGLPLMPSRGGALLLLAGLPFLSGSGADHHIPPQGGSVQVPGLTSDPLDSPSRLVISGRIQAPEPLALEMYDLQRHLAIVTSCGCPWLGGDHVYRGASLLPILQELGISQDAKGVELLGTNGYRVGIRMEDLRRHHYLIVYEMDGIALSDHPEVARQGHFMTVIDFSPKYEIDLEVYKFQFVWQLSEIRVL
jgi:hypothetical protein